MLVPTFRWTPSNVMNRSLRILHYTGVYAPAWSYGGPPRSVSTLCGGLAALGHEVTVFTTDAGLKERPDIPVDRCVRREGADVYYFPSTMGRMGLCSPALQEAVEKRASEFDVIHVTGVWQPTSRAACRAARRADKPYVCSPRGALGRYSFTQKPWKKWPYYWLWERANLNGASASHYTSRMELEECRRLGLRPPGFVVPNSVNLESWQRDEASGKAWRRQHGIGETEFVLLYAGRLHHKKGLDLLINTCAELPASRPWRLVLVGYDEDGTGSKMSKAFAESGRGERLLILPGVETQQLATIYSAADVFVFPSRHENFGNVAVEALACGCPVIISDQVGVADQLDGLAGVSVLMRIPGRWSATLTSRMQKGKMNGPVSRGDVEARFSPTAVAAQMAKTYEELLP
jgi:glycosyltransferase involved in cell wall biosynthesis